MTTRAVPGPRNVTAVGTADSTVRAITQLYDDLGRVTTITSHSATQDDQTLDNILNQIVREYNGLGQTTAEYQEHDGVKDGNTLAVVYTYDTHVADGTPRYDRGMRLEKDHVSQWPGDLAGLRIGRRD